MADQIKPIDRVTLLNLTIFVEAVLLLTATFWSHLAEIQLLPCLQPETSKIILGAVWGLGIAVSSALLLWLGKSAAIFSQLRQVTVLYIAPLFNDLGMFDLIAVAIVSGFCEEVLFRGVMQDQFGLIATSIIFGLFHCPSLQFISYGIWVSLIGLLMGILYQQNHNNLWVPIMAHMVSNGISLLMLRYAITTSPPQSPPNDS